ncbi:MAG TPA: BNR repeat-containing protein [Acidimicrobiia bacterium]|nr:BNR repeat-containing protein [Acidimicrobiia bacterium]
MGLPPVTLDDTNTSFALPSALNGAWGWTSQAHSQGCLWTDGPTQWAVWVDNNKKARIARRTHTKAWEASVDLSAAGGTALSAAFDDDSHNSVVVAVDDRGGVHVAGNMHGGQGGASDLLKYMRTSQPGHIAGTWVTTMVGTEESSVTYPQFVKAKNGTLYFFYRDGISGNGDLMLNKYTSSTKVWTRVGKIIDGKASSHSPYPQHVAVDRTTGRWHLIWCWRDTGDPDTNEDLCGAYSDDDGVTWKKYSDGSSYSLPITKASAEVIVDLPGGTTTSILNNGGLEVDMNGRPHVAILIETSDVYQIRHVYHDGSAWHDDQVSSFAASNGRRPALATFRDGRVWILYCHSLASGYIRVFDVTTPASVQQYTVHASDVSQLDVTFDTQGLYERDTLYIPAYIARTDGVLTPAGIDNQSNVPILTIRTLSA